MKFRDWLTALPGAPTPSIAAEAAKLPRPTLLRHAEKGRTTAENAIAIARAYGVAPADALVEMGFLNADEVGASDKLAIREALSRAEWEDIFAEITKRINASPMFEGEFELSLNTPIDFLETDELRARRAARDGAEEGVDKHPAEGWRDRGKPERSAADSSPREPGPGDDSYYDGP